MRRDYRQGVPLRPNDGLRPANARPGAPTPATLEPVTTPPALPYKLACLCDLRDEQGRILLIRRNREPNKGLCSPIGGKLDMATGESPAQCAQREIFEEAGARVAIEELHLGGLIAEKAFEGKGHWLLFYYRVLATVKVPNTSIPEGSLEWFHPHELETLPLPPTDRAIIWPLIKRTSARYERGESPRPGFFALHIDCSQVGPDGRATMTWSVEQEEA
jgi:8-oxo-dGTP diphosphatase